MRMSFVLIFLLFSLQCYAQNNFSIYDRTGYMMNIDGNWVFQSCADSNISVLNALNDSSFIPQSVTGDNGGDFYEIIKGYGRQIIAEGYDNLYNKKIKDTIYYFFCRLQVEVVDTNIACKITPCDYKLFYNKKEYHALCYYFMNDISEIEPLYPKEREKYIAYYKKYKSKPQWLK